MKQLLLYVTLLFTTSIFTSPTNITVQTPRGTITCSDYYTLEDVFQMCRNNRQCDRTARIKLYIGDKEVLEGSEFARKTRLRDFDNRDLSQACIKQSFPTTPSYPVHHEQYFYAQPIKIVAPNGEELLFSPDSTFATAFAVCRNKGLCLGGELKIAFNKNGRDCRVTEYEANALKTFQQVLGRDINNTEFLLIQETPQSQTPEVDPFSQFIYGIMSTFGLR